MRSFRKSQMPQAQPLRPSINVVVLAFTVIAALASTLIIVTTARQALVDFESEVLSDVVEERASATAQLFARGIWGQWQNVLEMAGNKGIASADITQAQLDFAVKGGHQISWAGYAGLDGQVIAASGGLLVGQSVEGRPWFQRGLEGPFAGDVHDAVLLAEKLPRVGDDLPRFLDLAAPLQDDEGSALGVVGFHINASWANQFLAETAKLSGIDAVLINREGVVVVGPPDLLGQSFSLASFGAARAGVGAALVEAWPDGRTSLSFVIPSVSYRDLPSFGWSLVARIDTNELAGARQVFETGVLTTAALVALVIAVLGLVLIAFYLIPFNRLARSADAIASGQDVYPYESRRTSELARLSGAIALFQANRDDVDGA